LTNCPAYADIAHRNVVLGPVVAVVLVGVAAAAWRRRDSALTSMSMLSLAGAAGVVFLFARAPTQRPVAFIWVNVAVWLVGICIWLTLGLAVVTALRPQSGGEPRARCPRSDRSWAGGRSGSPARDRRVAAVVALGVAGLVGTLVAVFPYGNQFLVDWPAVARVQQMTGDIQQRVAHGNVGIGILYNGPDVYQSTSDAHGVAYLLLVGGWTPGLEPEANQLLGLPVDPKAPFVAFTERGARVTGTTYFPVYKPLWFAETH
jgi:hypothetical protein